MGVANLSESTIKRAGSNGGKQNGTRVKVPGRTDRTASVKDVVRQRGNELKAERNRARTNFLNSTYNTAKSYADKASKEPMFRQLNKAAVKAVGGGN